MKRIGIISFHRAINYGGVLQVYALQKTILKYGAICEVIDYRSSSIERLYYQNPLKTKKGIKRLIYVVLKNGILKFNVRKFGLFSQDYLVKSNKIFNDSNIIDSNSLYDVFITGSDQVWSYDCADFDKRYFLDFVLDYSKKFSYAASFGTSSIPKSLDDTYKYLLESFNKISLREQTGLEFVRNRLSLNGSRHLDPTLLLTNLEWSSMSKEPKLSIKKDKYILIYMISPTKDVVSFAKAYANEHNLDVVYINDNLYRSFGVTNSRDTSPNEWVYLFQNASFIITNSFHGVAFSVNFNKNFLVELLKTNVKINARIIDFLEIFGLSSRIIDWDSLVDFDSINYDIINEKLNILRLESLNYINCIVGSCHEKV